MKSFVAVFSLFFITPIVLGQFGPFEQDFGYVDIREGAHTFYLLYYTTADVQEYTERPLIIWLSGGPGGSSVGYGNFEIVGPLDLSLKERESSWVRDFNVLFIDNPVGTGFSYVDDLSYLTTTNEEIAVDLVSFMKGFYEKHPEFETVPLYVYGQSYGGKMAVDFALHLHAAVQEGSVRSDLRGIAMGNAWIHPVDAVLAWAPMLESVGLIDQHGYDEIDAAAEFTRVLFNMGFYSEATQQWANTQMAVLRRTDGVDFYNVITKNNRTTSQRERHLKMDPLDYAISAAIHDLTYDTEAYNLNTLMNTLVKEALNIPQHVVWGGQANAVFQYQRVDFMKPVTEGIEKLLNTTDILVVKYNGNLDLICSTLGQIPWVERLNWPGAEGYRNAQRQSIREDGVLEGYYKFYDNFRFYWINVAGHSAPIDNPAGARAYLRDMTSFG